MTRVEHVTRASDLPAVLAPLSGAGGRPVLVLVGGAGGMDARQEAAVRTLLADTVAPVLTATGAVVVDGGTDAGVMRAIGAVHHRTGVGFPLVGVAARGTVTLPGEPVTPGTAELDRHHDLTAVVPGETWGDESRWLEEVATLLARRRPSVTLLVNGGDIALRDVARSIERGRPVVVVAGTGRLADDVAAAAAGSGTEGPDEVRGIASSPLTRIVPLSDGALLAGVLREHLTLAHP